MHKINTPTAVNGEFVNGNPATGQSVTYLNAAWFNTVQRELVNAVEGAGLTLNLADDTQLYQAIILIATNLGGTPAGIISAFSGAVLPNGWLFCRGQDVSRTTYAALFAAIGTTYGVGDGSTTFNVPDLRGEFIRGLDAGRGVDAGRVLGSAQADEFKNHQHIFGADDQILSFGGYSAINPIAYDAQSNGGGSGGHARTKDDSANFGGIETRPRNIALNYIIKV